MHWSWPETAAGEGKRVNIDWQPDGVNAVPLGLARIGFNGRVHRIEVRDAPGRKGTGLPAEEIERRLIELGFVEGADVRVLHQGLFGRDPIAVWVNGATVALRRREAMSILAL
jgi:ferrous iron transport protein A